MRLQLADKTFSASLSVESDGPYAHNSFKILGWEIQKYSLGSPSLVQFYEFWPPYQESGFRHQIRMRQKLLFGEAGKFYSVLRRGSDHFDCGINGLGVCAKYFNSLLCFYCH